MLDALSLPFVQRGALEILVLAPGAAVLGTWIVLRGQAFFVHAAGTAAFPGLVLADGLGFAAPLGALGAAGAFAAVVAALGRRHRGGQDSLVAVALVGALAAGALLASDVFESGARVDDLLFGSLLLIGTGDIVFAACCSAAVLALSWALGERWLAQAFDGEGAWALGVRSPWTSLVLLGLLAVTTVAALNAVGGLLVSALFVVPAATTRLVFDRLRRWQVATLALVSVEGVVGLWVSVETNTPPGAAIAMLAGAVFAVVAIIRALPLRRLVPATAMLGLLVLSGCGTADSSGKVVASTPVLADIARSVAGARPQVVSILRPNTDPHEYEPRPHDILHTAKAKLVITSGDGLDSWMGKVVREAGGDPPMVNAAALVPDRVLARGDSSGGHADPHWWHDPRNVEAVAGGIAIALGKADPGRAAAFRHNLQAFVRRVRALDRTVQGCIAAVPPSQRRLVTDHDAFGYFSHRYGVPVIGTVIPSLSTQGQASAADLSSLSKTIRREHVRAVFPEHSVNARVARALAAQTGATADHTLYGDTLGPPGSRGATYLSMERANADEIVRGLTGGRRGCGPGGGR